MMKRLIAAAALACLGTAQAGVLLSEGFEGAIGSPFGVPTGWSQQNNSSPLGGSGWFKNATPPFTASAGTSNSFLSANYCNGDCNNLTGTISNWLILPTMTLDAGAVINFAVRTAGGGFVDGVEVRLSTNGASTNVGTQPLDAGDFTNLVGFYFNNQDTGWVNQSYNLSSVISGAVTGRLAFRYFVSDVSVNGNYLGIDTVSVVPEPTSLALAGLALGGLAWSRRQRRQAAATA